MGCGCNDWVWFSRCVQFEQAERQNLERERAENLQALLQAEQEALITNDEGFECTICLDDVEAGEGVVLRNCLHQFCKFVSRILTFLPFLSFLRLCLKETIMKSPDAEVKCPFKDDKYECNAPLPEREIKQVGCHSNDL